MYERHHLRATSSPAGFTLIELMLVVAIIGVMAALAVPAYEKFVCKSQQTEAKAALTSYQKWATQSHDFSDLPSFPAVTNGACGAPMPVNKGSFGINGTPRYIYTLQKSGGVGLATFQLTALGCSGWVLGDKWTAQATGVTNGTNKCR
jgi:prepilin-type N-terminal cleavage/methylation domain-containing protein